MQEIYEIFNRIAGTNSRIEKEFILKEVKNNEGFQEALRFLLDPFIVTGLSTKKINKKKINTTEKVAEINTLSEMMDYLKSNNSGRDKDILAVQGFIHRTEGEHLQKFIKQLATKSLKIGVSAKTVNDAYGKNYIPVFEVMLAKNYKEQHEKIKGKFYVTLKLDGNRCIAVVDDTVNFFTRRGKPIEEMNELAEQFKSLPSGVYDGELLIADDGEAHSVELFQATQSTVRKKGEKKGVEFHIFDVLTLSEFQNGRSARTYEQRRNTLDTLIKKYADNTNNIFVLPVMYEGEDKSVIEPKADEVILKGFEGLMVNDANALYEAKRTHTILKVKNKITADLLVVSLDIAEDGQFEGLVHNLNVEYKGNLVGVGSGLSENERKIYKDDPDLIVGKIVEVHATGESKSEKTGLPSLRHPSYKGIRHDKTVDDINYGD
ncbi:ATP-dependent DNA ligase [Bacillus velezensis]|uniref:ATP-dependent DNA ligase n=1 Tax=Bacillus velezensis TaxID=492670 RepID=UPI0018C8187F|nr:ATP-dependent DNA ligase [Bacillus velezensis]QPK89896.1 ATP-dependent DNA ligase [Bacillus velezensis]